MSFAPSSPRPSPSPCEGTCSSCGKAEEPIATAPPLQGGRLVGAAAVVFLLPLVCAAGGAAWAGPDAVRQTLGALIGGMIGVGLAWAGVGRTRRIRRIQAEESV